MSYTVSIKEEISKIKSSNSELIAELSGYIRNNGIITSKKVIEPLNIYFKGEDNEKILLR